VIRWLEDKSEKERITRDTLEDLPEWFGIPEANDLYEREAGECEVVIKEVDGVPAGFFAVRATGDKTLSLHVLGVKREYHRQGIGKELFREIQTYAKRKGYRFLTVKTLDPSRDSEGYRRTRLFYERLGFVKVETFPTLWDEEIPCLFMARHVDDEKNTDGCVRSC